MKLDGLMDSSRGKDDSSSKKSTSRNDTSNIGENGLQVFTKLKFFFHFFSPR